MLKIIKTLFKDITFWLKRHQYRSERRLSDHRATNLAVRLTTTGALTPFPAIPSRVRTVK